jgi:hypothetical protein
MFAKPFCSQETVAEFALEHCEKTQANSKT